MGEGFLSVEDFINKYKRQQEDNDDDDNYEEEVKVKEQIKPKRQSYRKPRAKTVFEPTISSSSDEEEIKPISEKDFMRKMKTKTKKSKKKTKKPKKPIILSSIKMSAEDYDDEGDDADTEDNVPTLFEQV